MILINVGDIFKRVQRTFGDEANVQVTEADVVRWINDAQREAVMQNEKLLVSEGTLPTVAGTSTYDFPDNMFSLHHVYGTTDGETFYVLRYLSLAQLNEYQDGWRNGATGSPAAYTRIIEGQLTLIPVPEQSLAEGIKLVYSRYPTDVSNSSSELDLPAYLHGYVEHYCMMKAYEMDEDWEASDRKAAILQKTLDFNNNRETWDRDTYPSVSPLAEDYL